MNKVLRSNLNSKCFVLITVSPDPMSSRKSRLAPSKHHLQASNDPPSQLSESQYIARIAKPHGNSLYTVELASKSELLVELPIRFRNAIWVRRGGYVVVETDGFSEGKVKGEIFEVVRDEKPWRKMNYWYACAIFHLNLGLKSLGKRRATKGKIGKRTL
jgi:translation initiation factor IF-1